MRRAIRWKKSTPTLGASGEKIWEADLPEAADYYYRICSVSPLIVNSFSSHKCEIDLRSGAIKSREFLK